MADRQKYLKRAGSAVVAIQLKLDTSGFRYQKWGAEQFCKAGDWIVNNGGEVYTVDNDTFARTYQVESPGLYRKVASVWAEVADQDGAIKTKEGATHYKAGDYLVFNDEAGKDGYSVTAPVFEKMYEAVG